MKYLMKDNIGFVEKINVNDDPTLSVVNSARISYSKTKDTYDNKDRKLVNFLWNNNHTSPFRHTYYRFHIKAPIFVFRQWMKHQVGSGYRTLEVDGQEVSLEIFDHYYDEDKGCSWNEVSGRYVELPCEFYFPSKVRANPKHGNKQSSRELETDNSDADSRMYETMKSSVEESYKRYKELLDQGVAKEIARMVLPQNIYTECYWTVSLQSLLHFLKLRLDEHAQYEIRQYALGIRELIIDDLLKLDIEGI